MTLDLLELRALADRATRAPWSVPSEFHDGSHKYEYDDDQVVISGPPAETPDGIQGFVIGSIYYQGHHLVAKPADTAFIAAARSAVPALLDRVAELEAGLREAVNLASTNGAFCDPFTSGCDNPECKRLDALAALVTK